ncbi:PqqD family protein [Devriesea agamarum]|uniref:PqqD family protein n=1 Tax=Devriesea agamarum TaxID=472569 RepID=UPI00071DC524|nr:PqqD family protein [Devriesea agamarum]
MVTLHPWVAFTDDGEDLALGRIPDGPVVRVSGPVAILCDLLIARREQEGPGLRVDDLLTEVLESYDDVPDQARDQLLGLLNDLVAHGFVVVSDGMSASSGEREHIRPGRPQQERPSR